jgi:ribonuclease HI
MVDTINIWCDGACAGNPGPGGYAAAIVYKDSTIAFQAGYSDYTTNNRMELAGFINALTMALNELTMGHKGLVIIHTDSKYIENAINCGWLKKWAGKGFSKIKNPDLWQEVYAVISKCDFITVKWVKGHSGIIGNDIVDRLAVEAMNLKRTSNGVMEI